MKLVSPFRQPSLALPTLHIPIERCGCLKPRLCKRFCNLMMTFVTYSEPQASSQANLLIRLLESGGLWALGWGNPILHSFLAAPWIGPTELGKLPGSGIWLPGSQPSIPRTLLLTPGFFFSSGGTGTLELLLCVENTRMCQGFEMATPAAYPVCPV